MLNKYCHFLPHHWCNLYAISYIFIFVFYIAFIVGIYSLFLLGRSFITSAADNPFLYGAAFLQAVLIASCALASAKILQAFYIIREQTHPKN